MKQLKNHLKKKKWREGDVGSLVSLLQLCSSEQRTLAEVGKYVCSTQNSLVNKNKNRMIIRNGSTVEITVLQYQA